jgi:DinB superfamily
VTTEEKLCSATLQSWNQVITRADRKLLPLTDEQLQQPIAPGRNRVIYLLGHLTAVHDRMIPLLRLGDRLHPELDAAFITNPDRTVDLPLSASELKEAWKQVNEVLTKAMSELTPEAWLERHSAISEEDFAKEPHRNRLTILLSRTNHASFHLGQIILTH